MSKRISYEPPWYANARSWDEIGEHFTKWFQGAHLEMVRLIKHIKQSGLSNRLYAYTSLDKLVISIYEKPEPLKESLHITYDLNSDKWVFEYYGGPLYGQSKTNPEFYRVYEKNKGMKN